MQLTDLLATRRTGAVHMMRMAFATCFACYCGFVYGSSVVPSEKLSPVHRIDLSDEIEELACTVTQGHLQASKIFSSRLSSGDTRVVIALLKSKADQKIDLSQVGYSLARKRGVLGFAYGLCPQPASDFIRMWVATVASPYRIQPVFDRASPENSASLTIPQELAEKCRDLKVVFASSQSMVEMSKRMQSRKIPIPPQKGNLGIYCATDELGTLTLAVHEWMGGDRVPFVHLLQGDFRKQELLRWVNEVRKSFGLSPYDYFSLTPSAESLLLNSKSVGHDRNLLREIRLKLLHAAGNLMGENRVIGSSMRQIAQLLWLSPAHRALLLDESGKSISFALSETSTSMLLSMLVFGL